MLRNLKIFQKAYFKAGEVCFRVNPVMTVPQMYIIKKVKRSFRNGVTYVAYPIENKFLLWSFNNFNCTDTQFCYDTVCKDVMEAKNALCEKREIALEKAFEAIRNSSYDYDKFEIKISKNKLETYSQEYPELKAYLENKISAKEAKLTLIAHKIIANEIKFKA